MSVDRHADSLGIPLGIDASVEQQVVLTVSGQSLPMMDPSLVLTGVEAGSPLSRHGVAPGDVIVALNGARFRDLQHFGDQVTNSFSLFREAFVYFLVISVCGTTTMIPLRLPLHR